MKTFLRCSSWGTNHPLEASVCYAKSFHPKDEVSLMETFLGCSSWGTNHPLEASVIDP